LTARRAIVAGAGIAGLTTALALHRKGWDVEIFERRAGFEEEGAGIQLSPNATHILAEFGLLPALKAVALQPACLTVLDFRTGAVIVTSPFQQSAQAPFLNILRQDLHRILVEAIERYSIPVRFEHTFHTMQDEKALFRFREGKQDAIERDVVQSGDLVVQACGASMRFKPSSNASHHAQNRLFARRALLPIDTIRDDHRSVDLAEPRVRLWLGAGRHVVTYPVAQGRFLNIVLIGPDGPSIEDAAPLDTRGQDWQSAPRKAMAAAAPMLAALGARVEHWGAWALPAFLPRPMAEGHLARVGDSAHAMLPFLAQGGAMAIEDAAVLAQCVSSNDTAADLERYAQMREPRIKRVAKAAAGNGRIYHLGQALAPMRNLAMQHLGERITRRYDWIYTWRMPAGW
jgi:salicylate hydroxylase